MPPQAQAQALVRVLARARAQIPARAPARALARVLAKGKAKVLGALSPHTTLSAAQFTYLHLPQQTVVAHKRLLKLVRPVQEEVARLK